VQYVLCQGLVDLLAMQCDKQTVPFTTAGADPQVLTINLQKLFGGDHSAAESPGRLISTAGTATQGSDPYLSAKQTAVPSFPTYSGTGNGFLSFLAPGNASVNENDHHQGHRQSPGASCTSV